MEPTSLPAGHLDAVRDAGRAIRSESRGPILIGVATTSLLAMSLLVAFTPVSLGVVGQLLCAVGLAVYLLSSRMGKRIGVAVRSARAARRLP